MKSSATLGGVALAASGAISWRLQAGTAPYTAVFQAKNEDWDQKLSRRKGQPLDLVIVDQRGVRSTFQGVNILHEAPSSKPSVTSFVVADRRWKWPYTFIARDYNITKLSASGTRSQTTFRPHCRAISRSTDTTFGGSA